MVVNKSMDTKNGLRGPSTVLNPAQPAPAIAFRNSCMAQQELESRGNEIFQRCTIDLLVLWSLSSCLHERWHRNCGMVMLGDADAINIRAKKSAQVFNRMDLHAEYEFSK